MQSNYIDTLKAIVKKATIDEKSAKEAFPIIKVGFVIYMKIKNSSREQMIRDIAQLSLVTDYQRKKEMKSDRFSSFQWYTLYHDCYALVDLYDLAISSYKDNAIPDFKLAMHMLPHQIEFLDESIETCIKPLADKELEER